MIVGCDPGMTIHEVSPGATESGSTAPAPVNIQITATHQLIGERWYAPKITFINHSISAIIVTRAELATSLGVYRTILDPTHIRSKLRKDKRRFSK